SKRDWSSDVCSSDLSQHARSYDARPFLTPEIEQNIESRLRAIEEFARAYPLDRVLDPAPGARLGVVSSGKATLDALQALEDLALEYGVQFPAIRHYKVGLVWPLEAQGLLDFVEGLDHVLVVEEKEIGR